MVLEQGLKRASLQLGSNGIHIITVSMTTVPISSVSLFRMSMGKVEHMRFND